MARFSNPPGSGDGAELPQPLATDASPTFDKIILTSNGATDNITIGDDAIIGDGNVANHIVIIGQQDPTQGGIILGNGETETISSDGNGNMQFHMDGAAYIGDITNDNRIATLSDISGGSGADIADFVFTTVDSPDYESTMTITNKDMVIKTVVDTEASGNIRIESTQGMTLDANGDILIESKSGSDIVKARINLDQSNEQVLIEALNPDDAFFDDTQWSTAVWSGTAVTIENTPDIINFFNTVPGNISDVSINNGTLITYQGASYGSENITIDVGGTPPEGEDPLTITSIRFYYPIISKIDINYDNGSFDIDARNLSINMASTSDIDISSGDDVTINAGGDDLRLRAWDDITFTSGYNNGDQYEWRMNNNGRFELPSSGYIENPNGTSSDGNGFDTLHLVPDFEGIDNGTDQYIVIEPTQPNHIHIRAGGTIDASNAELILGGEDTHVKISDTDGSVTILANDITINSNVSPSALNINTYSGAVINSNRTSTYADEDKVVATLGDLDTIGFNVTSYAPTWSGTGLTFNGTPATGSYIKIGKLVQVQVDVLFTDVTNFGSGQYSITLPVNSAYHTDVYGGSIHNTGPTTDHYSLKGHLSPGSNVATLWFVSGSSQDQVFDHNSPITLNTTDRFHMSFSYICE